MERHIAQNSSMVVRARTCRINQVDATQITGNTVHKLKKYVGLNERTCNNKPIVALGDKVEAGQVIADGAATVRVIALGRNVLVGFMSYEGYNFEDAIIIRRIGANDVYTSIHIEEYDVEIRETAGRKSSS